MSLVAADVCIALEIEANAPGGVEDKVLRVVNVNCRTPTIKAFGFEVD